jgi:N-acetylneuraminic acid mutarotase
MRRSLLVGAAVVSLIAALLPAGCGEPTDPFLGLSPLIVMGDGQQGTVGETLPMPLIVQAIDSRGRPARRLDVRWTVTSGGGHPAVDVNRTDQNGTTFNHWTLGTTAGEPQRMEARVVGTNELLGAFSATAVAGPPAQMAASAGDGQTAQHGANVAIRPAVRVTDQYGNPAYGVTVTFTVTGGGGTVTGATVNPDANGIAAVGSWTLGPAPGPNSLAATASGLSGSPVTFTATGTVGAVSATQSTVTANPTAIHTSTGAVTSTITVTARDAGGFPISGATVALAASGAGVVLTQPASPTDVNGVATGTLSSSVAGSKTVSATIDQTSATQTAAVTVTVEPASAAYSTVGASPDTIVAGSGSSTITVTARNATGEPIVGATAALQVTGAGWTNVTQPTTATDANGVTTGTISQSCRRGPKVVSATIAGVTLTPDTVEVIPGAPGFISPNVGHQKAPVGTAVPIPPSVFVEDTCGNPVAGVPVEFTVTSGGGSIAGGPVVLTDTTGHATPGAWTLGPAAGANTLRATAPGSGIIGNPATFTATGELGFWTQVAEIPTRRFLLGAAALGGKVYAVGGVDYDPMPTNEAYDPAAGVWTALAPMPTARYGPGVGVIDGVLYAVGGTGTGNTGGEVEAYDPATDTWTTKASMPTRRVTAGVAVVNGLLYAIGGQGCPAGTPPPCSQALATVEAYDPATDTWTTKASMPTPRWGHGVAVVNGIIYAVGGTPTENVHGLNTVEAYDPARDTWSTRAPLPAPTWGLAVAGGNGVVYAAGGYVYDPVYDYVNTTASLFLYDPLTDQWRIGAEMPAARTYVSAAVLGGLLYILGTAGDWVGSAQVYHP